MISDMAELSERKSQSTSRRSAACSFSFRILACITLVVFSWAILSALTILSLLACGLLHGLMVQPVGVTPERTCLYEFVLLGRSVTSAQPLFFLVLAGLALPSILGAIALGRYSWRRWQLKNV